MITRFFFWHSGPAAARQRAPTLTPILIVRHLAPDVAPRSYRSATLIGLNGASTGALLATCEEGSRLEDRRDHAILRLFIDIGARRAEIGAIRCDPLATVSER